MYHDVEWLKSCGSNETRTPCKYVSSSRIEQNNMFGHDKEMKTKTNPSEANPFSFHNINYVFGDDKTTHSTFYA